MKSIYSNIDGELYIWFDNDSEKIELGSMEEFQMSRIFSTDTNNYKLICKTSGDASASLKFREVVGEEYSVLQLASA